MENAKKMILIEPEVLSRMKRSALEVSSTPLSSLDNDMENVLKLKKDDREKWLLYQQILQRYLHFTSHERESISIPIQLSIRIQPRVTVTYMPSINIL